MPRQREVRLETDLLVRARFGEELWVACARILRLALQVLSVVGEGRVGVFQVRCHCQSTHDGPLCAGGYVQSLPRSIFLFIEKMVSIICCCWLAIASTACWRARARIR